MASDRIGTDNLPFADASQPGNRRRGLWSPIGTSLAHAERELILSTVENYGGDKNQAAQVLGISLKTLYNRLHKYGVMRS